MCRQELNEYREQKEREEEQRLQEETRERLEKEARKQHYLISTEVVSLKASPRFLNSNCISRHGKHTKIVKNEPVKMCSFFFFVPESPL